MVAGHLQEKNDFYYIVLSYKDAAGKRKTKWEATGLSVKRNKKKAEALLLERRRNFMVSTAPAEIRLDDDILFSDFMLKWLEVTKSTIQITTYASYQGMVERVIVPYFRKRNIKLVDLKATDLQDFYTKQLERVKANSVIHYHANIHKALKYAVKIDLIPTNPADKVERPKKNEFKGSYYSADEIHALTEIAEGTKLEIPVLLASFYGLRRSEVLGLKWDAIDFEANTLEIKHIVTQASIDGKKVLVQADRAKTKSSLRTLPLVPPIRDRLLMLKGQQDTYRRLCGKSYNRDYLGYLCVDEIGNIIRPNYVSEQFPKLLEKNGLRPIRFHDLRHMCQPSSGKWRSHEADSGMVGSQRLLHHRQYLRPPRLRFQALVCTGDAGGAGLWQCVSMMPYAPKTGWTGDVPAKKNGQTNKIHLSIRFGGASGSRTLAPVSRPIAFRVRPLTTT